jgi:outer membrane autotransporter protein
MKLIAIAVASAMLMAGAAQAQTRSAATGTMYGELGYSTLKISDSGLSFKPGMVRGIFGYNFHDNFAVEGMLGFGVSKDSTSTTVSGVPVDVSEDVRHIVGIYVKPKAAIGDAFEVFGRLGYANTKVRATASAGGFTASDSGSDGSLSYGVGANFNVSPKMYVGVDYMRYFKKDDTKIDGFTVALGYRF